MATPSKTSAQKLKSVGGFAASWAFGGRRNALLALSAVAMLGFAATEAWKHYGATHAHWERYVVDPEDIRVTPSPAWVHADIKREAIRIGSLEKLSVLDRRAAQRVSEAFALHPWISKVVRVSKAYPASIQVEIAYRKPVAVVEVEHAGKPGLLPIDRDGVLLPPEDFSAGQVRALPRIAVGRSFPVGSVGSAWGDDRVVAAALVAEALHEEWPHTPLLRIEAQPTIAGGVPGLTGFEIVTRSGSRYVWGKAPGREESGEQPAAEKKKGLLEVLSGNHSNQEVVDLRTLRAESRS